MNPLQPEEVNRQVVRHSARLAQESYMEMVQDALKKVAQ